VITLNLDIDVDEVDTPSSFFDNVKVYKYKDYVLFNKEPSLQEMSSMAFRAKIMHDSYNIGINPCVRPTFNANFDGDKMNIFCASSYLFRVECNLLLFVDKCILSPYNSMLIMYAIQDRVTELFMIYKMDKVLIQSMLQDCIMMSHVHLDSTNIHTSIAHICAHSNIKQ